MKLSVSFFAFASVWHSVHGQDQSTILRGRGAEVEAAVEDEGASFGNIVNLVYANGQSPPSPPPPTPTSPTPPQSPTTITVEAESYLWMQGVQTEDTSNVGGGKNVGYIDTGDWMAYPEVTIPSTGAYRVEYRVACTSSGGSLQLEKAGGTQVYGMPSIQNTGGWQNWQTISHTVNLNAGPIAFGILAKSGGWNINWFCITMSKPTTVAPYWFGPIHLINKIPKTKECIFMDKPVNYFGPGNRQGLLYENQQVDIGPFSGCYTLDIQENTFGACSYIGAPGHKCWYDNGCVDNFCFNFNVDGNCKVKQNVWPYPAPSNKYSYSPAPDGTTRYLINGVIKNGVCELTVQLLQNPGPITPGCRNAL
jgi:hypothetical protein